VKKILCLTLAIITCLGTCASLVSCECDHVFGEEWFADETYHWRVCTDESCGEIGEKAEHDWDEGVQTLAPTQTSNGVLKYTCQVCGKVRTETVAADPTVSAPEWVDAFLLQDENYWMTIVKGQSNLVVKKKNGIAVVADPQAVNHKESYYSAEGEKYYRYDKVGESVTKQEITAENYKSAITLIDLQALAYGSFTYNEQGKTYVAQELTVGDTVYENVYIAFAGKKIIRMTFSKKEPGKAAEVYNINITYGTVKDDLVLPQISG